MRQLIRPLFAAALLCAVAIPAYAQQQPAQKQPAQATPAANDDKDWDVSLGAGVGVAPSYEGSGKYSVFPVPILTVNWRDVITLNQDGLNYHVVRDGALRGGIGLAYDHGRDEKDGSIPWGDSDNRLRGLGDVDSALGVRLFASYDLKPVSLDGSITQFFGDDVDGALVKVGVSYPYAHSEQLRLKPYINTTWASDGYMEPYFGITGGQAAASLAGLPAFNADAGFKDVSAGVSTTYFLDAQWYIMGHAQLKQLVGDAADSPISKQDTSGTLVTGVGYRF